MQLTYQAQLPFSATMSSQGSCCWSGKRSVVMWLRREAWNTEWIFINVGSSSLTIKGFLLKIHLTGKELIYQSFNFITEQTVLKLQTFNQI